MGLGADEAVLLQALWKILLDDAGRLKPSRCGIGGGSNPVAFVLDGIHGRFDGVRERPAEEAGRERLQERHRRGLGCHDSTVIYTREPGWLARRRAPAPERPCGESTGAPCAFSSQG